MYMPVTQQDITTGKNFILRREQAANGLASLIDALLEDAATQITQICYRYGIDPTRFTISPNYNPDMFKEIAEVLDILEEAILDLISSYATKCTKDEKKKPLLLLWILTLGKNNKGLKKSLEEHIRMFLKDLEAMITATASDKMLENKALAFIKSYLHSVYQMPSVQRAIKKASLYKAENIRTGGVKHGNVGSSSSEANNILRFAKMTVQMAWMRYHIELYEEQGAVGYYVMRGSTYPCEICDSMTGFHDIGDKDGYPMYHANCCCFTVPIFEKDLETLMQ